MNSGDVKYIAKRGFMLLPISFQGFRKEYLSKAITFIDFLRMNNASDKLIQATSEHAEVEDLLDGGISSYITSSEEEKILNYLAGTPEFLECGAHIQRKRACSESNDYDCNSSYLGFDFSKLIPDYLKYANSYDRYHSSEIIKLETAAMKDALPFTQYSCETSFDGDCIISDIKPGNYYLSNIVPIKIGQSYVNWDFPIKIEAGKQIYVELSNNNEAK